jgi:hypothetical protein
MYGLADGPSNQSELIKSKVKLSTTANTMLTACCILLQINLMMESVFFKAWYYYWKALKCDTVLGKHHGLCVKWDQFFKCVKGKERPSALFIILNPI